MDHEKNLEVEEFDKVLEDKTVGQKNIFVTTDVPGFNLPAANGGGGNNPRNSVGLLGILGLHPALG